ncbi:hypothetical protein [Arthrobacter woluwensis]|uniref:hypothetical protein n=1 Tax=Arthrobacter woluwensis TaxID=156980 RepID=UPI003818C999
MKKNTTPLHPILPPYMTDPRMAGARFIEGGTDGPGAGGDQGAGAGAGQGDGTDGKGPESKGAGADDAALGEAGKRALTAERAARAKAEQDLTAATARIKALEDAGKDEDTKRAERLEALEKDVPAKDAEIARLNNELLRYQVAAAEGLDLSAAARLQGSTKEELEADAKTFATQFKLHRGMPGLGANGGDHKPESEPGLGRMRDAYAATEKKN